MKMNWVEKFLMNNPIRAAFHVHVEAPLLERLGGRTEGLRVQWLAGRWRSQGQA